MRTGPILVAALLLVLSACSAGPGTVPGTSTGPAGQPTQSGVGPAVDSPITMTATEETDRLAQGTVTVEAGGSITATASDGSTFELVVPAGAVAGDVTITLTPLRDVAGLGASGPVHAVRMEPDGLEFFQLVRLTIRPSAPIPLEEQLMLIASGDGTDVGLAIIDPTSPADAPVLLLEHFTDGMAGRFSSQQQALFKGKSAENADKRLSDDIRDRLDDERKEEPGDGEQPDDLTDLLEEYKREVLDKLKEAAALSCDHLYLYVKKLISFERQVQLLGAEAEASYAAMVDEVFRILDQRYPECEREAIKRCTDAKDPQILIAFWLKNTEVGYQKNVPPTQTMKARAQQLCKPEGLQFHFTGSGPDVVFEGHPDDMTWKYWGLLCPEADAWQVWEVVDHARGSENTGTPFEAGAVPLTVTFDANGQVTSASWPILGVSPPGYLLHKTLLTLSPGDAPTMVRAVISGGMVDNVAEAPVVPWDGSFGICEAGT